MVESRAYEDDSDARQAALCSCFSFSNFERLRSGLKSSDFAVIISG
jgi:hypothetical protein